MDIFSSCWQGVIPYGAQLLTAAGIAGISPVEILGYLYYPGLMFLCGIASITFSYVLIKNLNRRKLLNYIIKNVSNKVKLLNYNK
ncbi:na+/H+ antiporter domain protein [[Clostridium] sordellii ATCC 9714]|nr:na+/H+ antiporter domain protein [[Clostridium] sordellii ATCC 9714] [Paeniclostridium sordellii ATCC 9714]